MIDVDKLDWIDYDEEVRIDLLYNPIPALVMYTSIGQAIPTLTWDEI